MKIAQLISTFLPAVGGAQICVHNISQRHVQAAHQVTVILPRKFQQQKTGDYAKLALWPGTMFLLTLCFSVGKMYLLAQIRRIQAREKFDLWQVTIGYPLGVAVVDYLNRQHIPCVLRCSGEDIQVMADAGYGLRRDKKVDALVCENYRKFDRVVAISEAMRDEYVKAGVPPERIVKIPNGVDVQDMQALRQRYAKKQPPHQKERVTLLTVGRNHPKKGFQLIPQIIGRLRELTQKDFVWILVGDGNEAILELAQTHGKAVSDRIKVMPTTGMRSSDFKFPSPELMAIYAEADIFVFPTFIETFGIVVIEAMAAGLPVVTTQAPGVDELVKNGVTGMKSPVNDPRQMAEDIKRLIEDERVYLPMSNNARQHSFHYDWNRISQQYLQLYASLNPQSDPARKS